MDILKLEFVDLRAEFTNVRVFVAEVQCQVQQLDVGVTDLKGGFATWRECFASQMKMEVGHRVDSKEEMWVGNSRIVDEVQALGPGIHLPTQQRYIESLEKCTQKHELMWGLKDKIGNRFTKLLMLSSVKGSEEDDTVSSLSLGIFQVPAVGNGSF